MLPAALLVLAYLIGSIPFSYLVVRIMSGADIRQLGSRNVGATNVARSFGKTPGIIALILDLAKGYAVIAAARWMTDLPQWPEQTSRELWIALAGLIAVLAHMFPVWLRFHGGKGVATAAGVFLALDPIVFAAAGIVFLIVIVATRFVSLASIVSAASIPLFFRFLANNAPFWRIIISIAIAIAVIAKHHSNIARLAQRKERRMGQGRDEQ
ncbi:MAG TPA: glycerol-3-phosphate 1-O-acyltransferase PlsY [Thermoanaerobaculia bacterium]|nr:glycerol-3-phosphate 1-O-acyltransferase PlsY [Thermoanaerobaculia bacterium]